MSDTLTETQVGLPQTGNRSFADILLLVAAFVVVGLGAAWFLSDSFDDGEEEVLFERPQPEASAAAGGTEELSVSAAAGEDVDVNLNKARMAAGADMLVEPAGQNALYYYSLVLDAEPEHSEAASELADVAEQVAATIRGHLGESEFVEAARLASMLANVAPGHPVIVEVQETLIAEQQRLVMEAVDLARRGQDAQAASRLATAESVPQVDDALIVTARKEIGAIRTERAAAAREAERKRQEAAAARAAAAKAASEKAAAEKAAAEKAAAQKVASTEPVTDGSAAPPPAAQSRAPEPTPLLARARASLAAGRLVTPADNSAIGFLARAEADSPDAPGIAEFRDELITAVSVAIRDSIDSGKLEDAEEMLIELESVSGADSVSGSLKAEVDRAFARRESARVISASEMLATKIIPPVYPRSAIRRGQEGWVQVEFTVLADGSTSDVEVVSASPEEVFDRASVQAVTQWQFRPRVFRGAPIDQRVTTKINFNLQDG